MGQKSSKAGGGGQRLDYGGAITVKNGEVSFNSVRDETDNRQYDDQYGAETDKFFKDNSNYDELVNEMNDSEKMAFEDWGQGMFMRGQQYKGYDYLTEEEQIYTEIYDKYLDRAVVNESISVVRNSSASLLLGKGNKNIDALPGMEGKTIFCQGNLSCAAASEGLSIGTNNLRTDLVQYKITIPGGTKGAGMYIGDSRVNKWGNKQREFMTNRDAYYKVKKVTSNPQNKGKWGKPATTVELVYLGHDVHDYGK